ncbi:hypothetical protein [Bifidobacterium vansinderenii]|uniref:hypothetical protein n=1 Tax=Bifidobacterium vansinderenii TaxID=1984871 RepID=UPI000B8AEA7B|nr:hypothetical protein [Bifidobacterium vansinderenii]
MSTTLDNLIDNFAQSNFRNSASAESIYAAQKKLEQDIVAEICEEQSQRIANRAKQLEQQEHARNQFKELRAVYIQCVFLALLIGLLGSHCYDLLKYWFYSSTTPDVDMTKFTIGLIVTLVICLGVCLWMFVSQIMKVYEMFIAKKD